MVLYVRDNIPFSERKDLISKDLEMQAVSKNLASINSIRLVGQAQCFTGQITNLANLRI